MIDEIEKKSFGLPWSRMPKMSDEMRQLVKGSADFLGFNYYTSRLISPRNETLSYPHFEADEGVQFSVKEEWKRGESAWLYVVPDGMYNLLKWIKKKYNNPHVIITENGYSDAGELKDDARIDYFKGHLSAVAKAIDEGCNITGYTAWSLIDNFEWLSGFSEKFGIFSVNMTSAQKERTGKKSSKFFKNLISDRTLVY
jgi:beta-glucosidase/6-phospho-beta-glucosidase/beta-galactosidase